MADKTQNWPGTVRPGSCLRVRVRPQEGPYLSKGELRSGDESVAYFLDGDLRSDGGDVVEIPEGSDLTLIVTFAFLSEDPTSVRIGCVVCPPECPDCWPRDRAPARVDVVSIDVEGGAGEEKGGVLTLRVGEQ